jgi:hypothetical protein
VPAGIGGKSSNPSKFEAAFEEVKALRSVSHWLSPQEKRLREELRDEVVRLSRLRGASATPSARKALIRARRMLDQLSEPTSAVARGVPRQSDTPERRSSKPKARKKGNSTRAPLKEVWDQLRTEDDHDAHLPKGYGMPAKGVRTVSRAGLPGHGGRR